MIYKKDAVFPYPILSNTSNSYRENEFSFNVSKLIERSDEYIFEFYYKISSLYINKLLNANKAKLVFIIQAGDNYFRILDNNQKEISIKKSRISLSNRTEIQLQIQTNEAITFSEATDLSKFYLSYKDQLVLKRNSLLGYSNEVTYEGSESKPIELFEQSIDSNQSEPFKVVLKAETILLIFKNRDYALETNGVCGVSSKGIKNMYFYVGLERALEKMIQTYGGEDDYVELEKLGNMEQGLEMKLVSLMQDKNIKELNLDNIDEVIQQISDKLVEKYTASIEGMVADGN